MSDSNDIAVAIEEWNADNRVTERLEELERKVGPVGDSGHDIEVMAVEGPGRNPMYLLRIDGVTYRAEPYDWSSGRKLVYRDSRRGTAFPPEFPFNTEQPEPKS